MYSSVLLYAIRYTQYTVYSASVWRKQLRLLHTTQTHQKLLLEIVCDLSGKKQNESIIKLHELLKKLTIDKIICS
jgi:hypothetical protein